MNIYRYKYIMIRYIYIDIYINIYIYTYFSTVLNAPAKRFFFQVAKVSMNDFFAR